MTLDDYLNSLRDDAILTLADAIRSGRGRQRAERQLKDCEEQHFAERAGVDPSTISRTRRGLTTPRKSVRERITAASGGVVTWN